jgi:hypothetical protein
MIGAEYRFQNWSEMVLAGSAGTFFNSNRMALGGSIIPALAFASNANTTNFFKKIEYRAGLYQENSYANVNGQQLQDYGMTLGLAIPLNHKLFAGEEKYSKFTISAAFGERGNLIDMGYRERYGMFLIGITVNDKWFNKFKYR